MEPQQQNNYFNNGGQQPTQPPAPPMPPNFAPAVPQYQMQHSGKNPSGAKAMLLILGITLGIMLLVGGIVFAIVTFGGSAKAKDYEAAYDSLSETVSAGYDIDQYVSTSSTESELDTDLAKIKAGIEKYKSERKELSKNPAIVKDKKAKE
ncbi:MAG: hypothetical protein LBM97_00205, partial [Candidatus Nomurabacteria bacterium]|nr:hypothetical protein [Candidatus Nomurabacteria bacterium]